VIDTSYLYACKHCGKKFTNEKYFMRHECTQMVRSKEILTPIGQQAYALYRAWLEKGKKKAPPIETFTTSTFYTSFMKFTNFIRQTSVSYPELYVELMLKQGISPALWTRDECYLIYVEHIQKNLDPYKQAEDTLLLLAERAEDNKIDICDVFKTMRYGEVLELVNKKKLSPWILFCSPKFKEWTAKLEPKEREYLMRGIGVVYWSNALQKRTDVVQAMKMIVDDLGL
jgi:hypothetical protein